MELEIPAINPRALWPTLGAQVAAFIETNLVFGPGDLRGERATLDDEQLKFLYRFYEVHPRGAENAGRRRFRRCALSLRKGTRKTELAAWIAAAELHPDAPVRAYGWRCQNHQDEPGSCEGRRGHAGEWEPVGRGVKDPYIPLIAYTQEQTEELAYGALLAILSDEGCAIGGDFDLGLERIVRRDGAGKAVPLATTPSSRDGARTTFEHFDEPHRMVLERQKQAHQVMLTNLLKRTFADPWALETTTMFQPGQGSVAEDTFEYARRVESGEIKDSALYFYHRQASESIDISTPEGLRKAVLEASGITAAWSDIDGICRQWDDPSQDKGYLDRVWLNRPVHPASRAFDAERWKALAVRATLPAAGSWITLGFDGSMTRDATALIATDIVTGFQWPEGIWTRPENAPADWKINAEEVNAAVARIFKTYKVWRLNADPPYWETEIRNWAGLYGDEIVVEFPTMAGGRIGPACRAYATAITNGDVTHNGSPQLTAHIGNACKRQLSQQFDDQGQQLWTIQKDRPNSPNKIDAAMAAVLSWEARTRALAAGVGRQHVRHIGAFIA